MLLLGKWHPCGANRALVPAWCQIPAGQYSWGAYIYRVLCQESQLVIDKAAMPKADCSLARKQFNCVCSYVSVFHDINQYSLLTIISQNDSKQYKYSKRFFFVSLNDVKQGGTKKKKKKMESQRKREIFTYVNV